MNKKIQQFNLQELENINKVHPDFRPGDQVRVHFKIEETTKSADNKKKFRIQLYEGVCTKRRGALLSETFTVRKSGANGIGVERTFPLNSPLIERIDIISGGRVRRARLYYLRDLSGKAARIKERRLPAGQSMTTVTK